ncbi:hypothetical protein AMTRI_Chr08g164140 [Amborella trichopoda]
MDWSHYPFGILMVLTHYPSSLDLESIASYLAYYLPFYPVLSPICRVSSSLISFYRAHGNPLIPRTAFPLLDIPIPHFHLALNPSFIVGHIIENGAFSPNNPLPLCLPLPPPPPMLKLSLSSALWVFTWKTITTSFSLLTLLPGIEVKGGKKVIGN